MSDVPKKLEVFIEDDGTVGIGIPAGIALPFDRLLVARMVPGPGYPHDHPAIRETAQAMVDGVNSRSAKLNEPFGELVGHLQDCAGGCPF